MSAGPLVAMCPPGYIMSSLGQGIVVFGPTFGGTWTLHLPLTLGPSSGKQWDRWISFCGTFGSALFRTPWVRLVTSGRLFRHGVLWCWRCRSTVGWSQGCIPHYLWWISRPYPYPMSNLSPPCSGALGWSGEFGPPGCGRRLWFPVLPRAGRGAVPGGRLYTQL